MELCYRAKTEKGLSGQEILSGVLASIEEEKPKRALLLPPDFTRYHSNAGLITNMYYHVLTDRGCNVDIMPALGSHVPVTREQADKMFGDIPFKKFASQKSYHSEVGYSGISDDSVVLAVSKAKPIESFKIVSGTVYNAFYRDFGKGRAISYYGPITFEDDAQDIFGKCAFPALLDDVITKYSKDLKIRPGEVVRGEIDGGIYALYPNGEIKEIK